MGAEDDIGSLFHWSSPFGRVTQRLHLLKHRPEKGHATLKLFPTTSSASFSREIICKFLQRVGGHDTLLPLPSFVLFGLRNVIGATTFEERKVRSSEE